MAARGGCNRGKEKREGERVDELSGTDHLTLAKSVMSVVSTSNDDIIELERGRRRRERRGSKKTRF